MRIAFVLTVLIFSACSSDRTTDEFIANSFFQHLHDYEASQIVIQANFDQIIKENNGDKEYIAQLFLSDNCAQPHKFNFKLSTRGITRNEFCDFPPLKLNLVKDEMPDELIFHDHPPYKLVTHCKDTSVFNQYVLREFLCYRLLNELTETSLEAKYLDVQYQNESGDTIYAEPGIVIENVKDFAQRLGFKKLKSEDPIKRIDKKHYRLIVLFQFMLGNTDWSLSHRHNMEFVQNKAGDIFIIPYDFDYSGLVNTYYAKPHPQLPIEHVQERMLQYRGEHTDELNETITYFLSKKPALLAVIDRHDNLVGSLESTKQFVEDFYSILETPDSLQTIFEQNKR